MIARSAKVGKPLVLAGLVMFLSGLATLPAEADPAMWVVKDPDSTIYLLGTIHVMKPDADWRTPKLEEALKASAEYWMEADISEDAAIAQTYILNFGFDHEHPLAEKLKAADYAKLIAVAKSFDLPADKFADMRPWFADMALTQAQVKSLGYDPEQGVDITLEREAKAAGKPVKTFETATEQLGFISGLPEKAAAEMLVQDINNLDKGNKQVDAMMAAWQAGDVKALQKVGFNDVRTDAPGYYEIMIVKRNKAWVKTIESMLQGSGTAFIAVGCGHLIGPDSVPAQLKAAGYRVERY